LTPFAHTQRHRHRQRHGHGRCPVTITWPLGPLWGPERAASHSAQFWAIDLTDRVRSKTAQQLRAGRVTVMMNHCSELDSTVATPQLSACSESAPRSYIMRSFVDAEEQSDSRADVPSDRVGPGPRCLAICTVTQIHHVTPVPAWYMSARQTTVAVAWRHEEGSTGTRGGGLVVLSPPSPGPALSVVAVCLRCRPLFPSPIYHLSLY
jgi:hypothetical protein